MQLPCMRDGVTQALRQWPLIVLRSLGKKLCAELLCKPRHAVYAARLGSSWCSGAIEENCDIGRRGGEILVVVIGSRGIGNQRYEHGLHLTMAVQGSQLLDPDRLMTVR